MTWGNQIHLEIREIKKTVPYGRGVLECPQKKPAEKEEDSK